MSELPNHDQENESRLLEGLRAGNEVVFDELACLYYSGLSDYAANITRESASALDVVQDVLLNIWQNRATIAPATTLRAYLFRAVRNRALNHNRSVDRQAGISQAQSSRAIPPRAVSTRHDDDVTASLESLAPGPDSQLRYKSLVEDYTSAIQSLPDRRQAVYRLIRLYGLSYLETASILDISENTVRTQMSDALRQIRAALSDYLE